MAMNQFDQERLDLLAGTRAGYRDKAAVRVEDLEAILQMPSKPNSGRTTNEVPSKAGFNAAIDDIYVLHARLRRVAEVLQGRLGIETTPSDFIKAADGDAGLNLPVVPTDYGYLSGFRNKIINGNFDIWQRGTTATAAGYAIADRWFTDHGDGAATVGRQMFTAGQTDVPGNPAVFLRHQQTLAASTAIEILSQRIERVATLAGQTVTVTFYAKAAAPLDIDVAFTQHFGTGGTPSSAVAIAAQTISLKAAWQRFSLTFDVPSIAGKTLGSNGDDYLETSITCPSGATFVADIARISVVEGDATAEADPFAPRHVAQELQLCRRYFHRLQDLSFVGQNFGSSAGVQVGMTIFPSLRGAPTVSIGGVGSWSMRESSGSVKSVTSVAEGSGSPNGIYFRVFPASGSYSGGNANYVSTGSTGYIDVDAEL